MSREQLFNRRQRLGGIVHDVVSGAAVNVKINVTRCDSVVAKVGRRSSRGNLAAAPSGNIDDTSLLDEHERMLDSVSRSQQPSSSKGQHRNVLIAVTRDDCDQIVAAFARPPAARQNGSSTKQSRRGTA